MVQRPALSEVEGLSRFFLPYLYQLQYLPPGYHNRFATSYGASQFIAVSIRSTTLQYSQAVYFSALGGPASGWGITILK